MSQNYARRFLLLSSNESNEGDDKIGDEDYADEFELAPEYSYDANINHGNDFNDNSEYMSENSNAVENLFGDLFADEFELAPEYS